jgi:hypothetical protein
MPFGKMSMLGSPVVDDDDDYFITLDFENLGVGIPACLPHMLHRCSKWYLRHL